MEGGVKACCGVKRGEVTDRSHSRDANYHSFATSVPEASEVERSELRAGLVPIPGGIFEMGAEDHASRPISTAHAGRLNCLPT